MSEAKVDIWMPLSIGDYLADTSHLNTTQHGAYLLMLMHYWRKGPLPNDPAMLANIAKLSADDWKISAGVLIGFFTLADDGLLHQNRSDIERAKAMGQKRRGKAGAAAKWGISDSQSEGKVMRSQRMAEARLKGTHTSEEWVLLQAFCRHQCVRCDASNVELVKDHIIPVYQGGSDGIDNIQPLCRPCNARKGPEAKDFRQEGWQNACKTPAECMEDGWTLPLPLPKSKEQKQKPSRVKPESDKRHMEFKVAVKAYWDSKNSGVEMPWGPAEGKQLGMFLREAPHITLEQFTGFLRARFKSQVNHGERPCQWLKWVTSFGNGPIDRFNKPIEEGANGNTQQQGANGAGQRSAASTRITTTLDVLSETLASRGLEEFRVGDRRDGKALPEPGSEIINPSLLGRLREVGDQILNFGGDRSNERAADQSKPTILPPA